MVLGDIGAAIGDQTLDHRLHFRDMLGRARLHGRRQGAERRHVFVKLPFGLLRDLADRLVQRQIGIILGRARVDLVVDIGDVADIGDVIVSIEVAQQAKQHVEDDDRPRVADMGEVVDRGPAHIHAHIARIEGLEGLLLTGERVVELKRHDSLLPYGRPGVRFLKGEE